MRILDETNKEKWNWTGAVDIAAAGVINLLARSVDKQVRFLKIKISLEGSVIFIEFDEQDPNETSLRVQNDLENVDIVFYQTCAKASEGFKISGKGSLPYSWHNPCLPREIYVDFQYGGKINYHSGANKYSFDELNKVIESVFPIPKQGDMKIHSVTEIHGKTRIMRFYPASEEKKKKVEEVATFSFQVKLTGVGFSLISTTETQRIELLYASIKGIDAAILTTNLMQAYQFRIKYINCDNNTYVGSFFPVFLTPLTPKELLAPDSKSYFADILIRQNLESLEVI